MSKKPEDFSTYVFVCTGKDCRRKGGKDIAKQLKGEVRAQKRARDTRVLQTRCTDNCKRAPVIAIMPANAWVTRLSVDASVEEVLRQIANKGESS